MPKHDWKDDALCLEYDTNLFFDKYEDDELLRPAIDKLCSMCPVSKMCFAVGVSQKAAANHPLGPSMWLRQLFGDQLPRTARAGAEGAAGRP